jgi:cytochrome c-type biogenesis protein CcmH
MTFWILAAALTFATATGLVAPLAKRSSRRSVALALAVPALALPLYLQMGSPEATDLTAPAANAAEIAAALDVLKSHLAETPDDVEGWILLGRVSERVGERVMAADAYANAARRLPADATVKDELEERVRSLRGVPTESAPE